MTFLLVIFAIALFILGNLAMDKDGRKKRKNNNIDFRWKNKKNNWMDENNKRVEFNRELRGSRGVEKKELAERKLYGKLDGKNLKIEEIEHLAKLLFRSDYKMGTKIDWEKKREELDKNTTSLDINTPLPFPSIAESYDENLRMYEALVWFRQKMANELYEELDKKSNSKFFYSKIDELEFVGIPNYPVADTGDASRQSDFILEARKNEKTTKYLYLVKIKSRVDNKNYIKIGITSKENIEKRFEEDDVMELLEVIRSVKLEAKLAMSAEYALIRKYRPKDYFAEKEFDAFSRFGGYTEVVPMRNTTKIGEDIDKILKNSKEYTTLLDRVVQDYVEKEML